MERRGNITIYLDTNILANYILFKYGHTDKEELKKRNPSIYDRYYKSVELIETSFKKEATLFTSSFCLLELNNVLFETAVIVSMINEGVPLKYLNDIKKEKKDGEEYAKKLYEDFFDEYVKTEKITCLNTIIDLEKGPKEISRMRRSGIELHDAIVCYSCLTPNKDLDYFISSDGKFIEKLKKFDSEIFKSIKFLKTEEMLQYLKK